MYKRQVGEQHAVDEEAGAIVNHDRRFAHFARPGHDLSLIHIYEANTIHNPVVKGSEAHRQDITPATAEHQASAPVHAPAAEESLSLIHI